MKITILLLCSFSFTVHAVTEEQCKPEALKAHEVLENIDKGHVLAMPEHIARLNEAVSSIDKGDFCTARRTTLDVHKELSSMVDLEK